MDDAIVIPIIIDTWWPYDLLLLWRMFELALKL